MADRKIVLHYHFRTHLFYGINFRTIHRNRGDRKVKYELNQGLVMTNLYMKFNVHSSNAKQVTELKVVDSRMDRQAAL